MLVRERLQYASNTKTFFFISYSELCKKLGLRRNPAGLMSLFLFSSPKRHTICFLWGNAKDERDRHSLLSFMTSEHGQQLILQEDGCYLLTGGNLWISKSMLVTCLLYSGQSTEEQMHSHTHTEIWNPVLVDWDTFQHLH